MATFAPCSAKATAMAWPMPELPPVTSTFLPSRPGSRLVPGAEEGRVLVMGMVPLWGGSGDCSCSGVKGLGVTRPGLARLGRRRVEVGLAGREDGAEVGPQLVHRGPAPEPVAD